MSAQALLAELTSLAQESKRKSPEIRNAAEKSLQELRALPITSEQQLAADLSRRPNFIEPFIISCGTRNVKFAGSGVTCLQRLAITRGLPRTRLKDVLEALNACISLALDIQLKVLQALPALAQNYAEDLKGDLLATAVQVCAALQNAKIITVSAVAAATLQQIVVSVYDKVVAEDARLLELPVVHELEGDEGPVGLRAAAYDAYRLLQDICLATEGQKTKFIQLTAFSQTTGLELIWACLNTHADIFKHHPEQRTLIRSLVMPLVIRVISERQSFPVTLRVMRIASIILRQYLPAMPEECEIVLGLLTHMLDLEAATPWKRAMCMEVFRNVYTEPGLALQIYMRYDDQEGRKAIIRDNVATFVRISTERPAIIGLGQQSTIPTGSANQRDGTVEQVAMEAAGVSTGGVPGAIGSSFGVGETNVPGISTQWSSPKALCLDQLDKSEPPPLPETYTYSLVLECLNNLSENLARVVLPLTVQRDNVKSRKGLSGDFTGDWDNGDAEQTATRPSDTTRTRVKRSQSYRSRTVPLNPLSDEQSPGAARVRAIASLLEDCWPALLATCSTFLYAAMDNDYYRSLIRSFQRFAQVAGLLRLPTARDAFLTTLGKAAVPPNVLSSSLSARPLSAHAESPSLFTNAKGLLSVDSLASHASSGSRDRSRRPSHEPTKPSLTTRNLLCLRALLNIAIALGPTLEASFGIVLETLQQADVVLSATNVQQNARDIRSGPNETTSDTLAISAEIAAVESAALRLFESTADYPNDAFLHVLKTLCTFLEGRDREATFPKAAEPPPLSPLTRRISSLPGLNTDLSRQSTDYLFTLSKIGQLSDLNTSRFASYPAAESGWRMLVEQLVGVSVSESVPKDARRLAADILCRCAEGLAEASTTDQCEEPENVQKMIFSSLQLQVTRLYAQSDELTSIDVAIHGKTLEAVRSILEKCGEALTAGWDTVLAMIGTVFHDEEEEENAAAAEAHESWMHLSSQIVAPSLGRTAFGAIQLVCSDFLPSLPDTSLVPLIELLYHFASQNEDINASLTTVTLFLDVSDFLCAQEALEGLPKVAEEILKEQTKPSYNNILSRSKQSRSMQWILLLYRLTDVVSDERPEVRNSALQTLLRVFRTNGDHLTTTVWRMVFTTLLLKMLQENVELQTKMRQQPERAAAQAISNLEQTSKALFDGVAALVSENLGTIAELEPFPSSWDDFIKLLEQYLLIASHALNAAVYSALSQILGSLTSGDWSRIIEKLDAIWQDQIPCSSPDDVSKDAEQDAYIAYVDCLTEIHRLHDEHRTRTWYLDAMARSLVNCVRHSSATAYVDDVNNMTPLQARVLERLKTFRSEMMPARLVDAASEFVALPFESVAAQPGKKGLTFIALSKASMDWLSTLLISHMQDEQLFEQDAAHRALVRLTVPLDLKYRWRRQGRTPSLWRKATTTGVMVIEPLLVQLQKAPSTALPQHKLDMHWTAIVAFVRAVMSADCSDLDPATTLTQLAEDEDFDCESLLKLRDMLIPGLGSPSLPASVRGQYAEALFHNSIIHAPGRSEMPSTTEGTMELAILTKVRAGRIWDPAPATRETLAYLALEELIALVAKTDGSAERLGLARAALPYLLHRLAQPIHAYVADQPLRGSMPQPLSQVEELLFCLRAIKTLRCEPEVFAGPLKKEAETRSRETLHVRLLYPLVVKAVVVAGDRRHGDKEVLSALQDVLSVPGLLGA